LKLGFEIILYNTKLEKNNGAKREKLIADNHTFIANV